MEQLAGKCTACYSARMNRGVPNEEQQEMEVTSEGREKKPRKRMKSLYSKIRGQIEFYFSDSNLHRDRFMKKVTAESKDGFIDIGLFLNFNKIKDLTTDLDTLQKALKLSKELQVSEDGEKVKRLRPLTEPKQLDERTVYVECLPHHVDHVWIRRLFSGCGQVMYVSIPRYKTTGDPKGFAFVEFETVEGAKKACEELNNPPVEAEERPGKFPKTRKQLLQLQRKLGNKGEEAEGIESGPLLCEAKDTKDCPKDSPTKQSKRQKRRRRQTSESSIDGTVSETSPLKRRKTLSVESDSKAKGETEGIGEKSDVTGETKNVENSSESKSIKSLHRGTDNHSDEEENKKPKKSKKRKSKSDAGISVIDTEADGNVHVEKSDTKKRKIIEGHVSDSSNEAKKRKVEERSGTADKTEEKKKKVTLSKRRKRKKKKQKEKQKEKDVPELRVISKKEWLGLRTEYLSLQKESMTSLKQTLSRMRQDSENDPSGPSTDRQKPMDTEKPSQDTKPGGQSKSKVEFVPDVIVSVKSAHPCTRKQLKEFLGEDCGMAYVDLIDGDCTGYIRFKDSDSAMKATNAQPQAYTLTLVQGEDEKQYWTKLQSDRDAKLGNKTKSKRRGTQKLDDKAQKINKEYVQRKHIVFDD